MPVFSDVLQVPDESLERIEVRPQSGCPKVLDPKTGLCRPAVLADVRNMATLNDALPDIDLAGALLYPSDIHARGRDVATLAAILASHVVPPLPAEVLAETDRIV